jgi:hypothetical protein
MTTIFLKLRTNTPGDFMTELIIRRGITICWCEKIAEENCKELVVGTIPITYIGHLGLPVSFPATQSSKHNASWVEE